MGCSRLAGAHRRALVALLLALPMVPSGAAASSLEEAVGSVEAAYRRVQDLKATFQQAAFNRTMSQTVEARGTLYLKKPGRLRWEYVTPTPQELVSDGKTLWVYTPELKQVNVAEDGE